MCSASREGGLAVLLAVIAAAAALLVGTAEARTLRVCADPNNLPFSNAAGEGFENRIAALLADEIGAEVAYTWWAQRRGFFRNTLQAGLCDLIPGVAAGIEMLRTTRPYYRSTYVFVTRSDGPVIGSLDDPRLRSLRIGVQLVGDDGANPPPVHALARRGIVGNVRGYPVYGDYAKPNPAARIIHAVAAGEIDVAIAWGPFAGYFVPREAVPLRITGVEPVVDGPRLPMAFHIGMGVRRDDVALHEEIGRALSSRRTEIDAILAEFGVPRLDEPAPMAAP